MKKWWSALSLKNKLQIPIQIILLLIMVVAQRWAFNQFEARILEAGEAESHSVCGWRNQRAEHADDQWHHQPGGPAPTPHQEDGLIHQC